MLYLCEGSTDAPPQPSVFYTRLHTQGHVSPEPEPPSHGLNAGIHMPEPLSRSDPFAASLIRSTLGLPIVNDQVGGTRWFLLAPVGSPTDTATLVRAAVAAPHCMSLSMSPIHTIFPAWVFKVRLNYLNDMT